jgi:hypothetical protein
MKPSDVVRYRLHNQLLTHHPFDAPGDVVRWFGAVQAQDYPGGLWAVGLRTPAATEADVERAIAERAVVRTWPMRGTLHFVAAEDVRWMLELLTPRVVAGAAARYRQLELDDDVFAQSRRTLERALRGGKRLTRPAAYRMLEAAGIRTSENRGLHILGWLAQKGVVCFGPREGKQQTFALLEEWVPAARPFARDEALGALAERYFTSHGPATLHDFAWWSGLRMADARAGLASVESRLIREQLDGRDHWLQSSAPAAKSPTRTAAHLLPIYDEYTVAYRDRAAAVDPAYASATGNGLSPGVVLDGRVVGTWKRASVRDEVVLSTTLFVAPSKAEERALAAAAERYGAFLGRPVRTAAGDR